MNTLAMDSEAGGFSLLWPGHLDHPNTTRDDVVGRIGRATDPVRQFSIAWQSCSFYSHNERVDIAGGLLMAAKALPAAYKLIPEYE